MSVIDGVIYAYIILLIEWRSWGEEPRDNTCVVFRSLSDLKLIYCAGRKVVYFSDFS